MNIPRVFLLSGGLFLILGIGFGMHMAASGDHTMVPVHAHINLLGFAVMSVFGLVYRAFPAMAQTRLAQVHFGLHLGGSLVLLVMLYLMFSQRIAETSMVPLAPIAEVAVLAGVLIFVFNLWKNGR